MKKSLFILIGSLVFTNLFSQDWMEKMQDPNANFYDIQKSFNDYWKDKDIESKGRGYKVFKRWEAFVEPRVYPSGNLSQLGLTAKNYQEFFHHLPAKKGGTNLTASSTWTAVGPIGTMNSSVYHNTAGCLVFVKTDPNNPNTLYTGGYASGLWKSTNGGVTWATTTDNQPLTGCWDLGIDPTNSNILYLGTNGVGVYKSTDGGNTWNTTGLSNTIPNWNSIMRILVNQNNPQIVIAATSNFGIYRTTNGGTNWTQVSTANCKDLEFKPNNPNIVYASGRNGFYRSTNAGASFVLVNNGIPNSGLSGMKIAVTPADSNRVYAICANNTDGGWQGFYMSVSSGTSFVSTITTTLNMLGYSATGNGPGGQGSYDLDIAASPLNKDEVIFGGINLWRSVNAGTNFSLMAYWITGGSSAANIHADQQDLFFDPSGTLYATADGGVYRYGGGAFNILSGNMNIAQMYKMGLSGVTANKWISGHQDNGTNIWNGTSYDMVLSGDGMGCFFDRTNDNNVFGSINGPSLYKSTNGGSNFNLCTTGLTGGSGWVLPWKQDPVSANTMYAGKVDLFKSTNLAGNWTPLAPITGTVGTIIEFDISTSNNQVIYVLKATGVYKTINGGTSWTDVTGTIPVGSAAPTYVMVDPTDANTAWVTLSGYFAANKVFRTTDGGASWQNISFNLPNIPAKCSVYQNGTNDRVYVGMDVGVYYMDNTASSWTLYNTGLPNVPVSDLEISPANPTKLYASTYARGVYMTDLFLGTPVSSFSINTASYCSGDLIQFNDMSTLSPTSWSWSVSPTSGVNINSPTAANTSISFANAGTYTVSLMASNGSGPGTVYSNTVTIYQTPTIIISNNSQTVCVGNSVVFTATGGNSYSWSLGGGSNPSAIYTPTVNSVYTVWGTNGNGCFGMANASVVLDPCVGIKEINETTGIKVYPIPNKGIFTLELFQKTTAVIYNSLGSVIFTKEFNAGNHLVDISDYSSGIYYLKTTTAHESHFVKIVSHR